MTHIASLRSADEQSRLTKVDEERLSGIVAAAKTVSSRRHPRPSEVKVLTRALLDSVDMLLPLAEFRNLQTPVGTAAHRKLNRAVEHARNVPSTPSGFGLPEEVKHVRYLGRIVGQLLTCTTGSDVKKPRKMATTPQRANAEATASGWTPLESYPGRIDLPWLAKCQTCGHVRGIYLNNVRRGRRCRHVTPPMTNESAVAMLLLAGYRPQESYPGALDKPWHVTCTTCNRSQKVRMENIKADRKKCRHKRKPTTERKAS